MTISVLQSDKQTSSGTTVTSQALTFTSSVTAGSSIWVVISHDTTHTVTLADNLNGSYGAALDTVTDSTDGEIVKHFKFDNSAAGSITVTATFTSGNAFGSIWILEIGGTSGYDGIHSANLQLFPVSTSTDVITSGTATPNTQPGLIVALSTDTGTVSSPAVGTGFTAGNAGAAGWNFGTANNSARVESKRYTSLSSLAATFTATNTDSHITVAAFFKEASVNGTGGKIAWII